MAGSNSDVRVRLSAEGQAEVIAAFQKIASEGKKAGKESATAFAGLNDQLKEVGKTLAGGIGLILVAEKFKEFFKSTLEGAETLTRLSKQTGLSTDLIQGFGRAARETGLNQESANQALAKFTVQVGKAGIGSRQSRDALSDLGITIKDFSKLSPDKQFEAVAQKLSGIVDPARRARDEVALFGRSGKELDQALQAVGREGIDPFVQHMKDLGVFLDAQTIASIKGAAESFKNLGDTVKGVATQFLTGLVPGLQAAADELLRATTGPGVNGFKTVGELIGKVFRGVIFVFEIAGSRIGALAAKTVTYFEGVADLIAAIPKGFNAVVAAAEGTAAKIDAITQARDEAEAAAGARLRAEPEQRKAVEGAPGGEGSDGANAAALAKARLSLLEARLANELKLFQAHAALVKESDRQAYEDGQISLTEYFARRAALINEEADKELATLKAKRAAVAASAIDINDPVAQLNQKKELAALDNQIAIEQIKRAGDLAQNVNEQANAQRKLAEDTLKNELKLLEIAGKKTEAAKLKLALDLADLDAELRKAGVSDPDRAAAVGKFAAQGNASNSYGAAATKAKTDLQNLTTQEKELQDKVRDGQLFSIDAAQQLIEKQKQMLPTLEADAAAMTAFAEASKDPELIAAAAAYQQKIDAIKVSTNQLGQSWQQFNQGLENAAGTGINKFLTDLESGTKSLKSSFKDMALSIVQDILKMETQAVEAAALKAIFSSFSGGGSVSASAAPTAEGFAAAGLASGGHIRGPGTSTSDSIPARLSDGEFVVNAKSVSQPGVLPLLNALNSGALKGVHGPTLVPKFAGGGQVGGASRQNVKFVNVLDPSLLGDHLATAAGEQSVLNVISRNPNKVRASL